jgi:TusA-related sulfurtransferase
MENETLIKPNIVVDMTGQVCPHPLLGAKRVLGDMRAGEVLLLKSDCPGTRDDLFSWAKATGNEVTHSEKQSGGATGYYVRKGKKAAIAANVTLDVTGLVCPGPVIEARRIFNTLFRGQVMKLVSTCPSARDEVGTWCAATGNALLDTQETGPGVWAFFIRKG